MNKKPGILHIYSNTPNLEGVYIVGDEKGLYSLWRGIEKALIPMHSQGRIDVQTGRGTKYPLHILCVDPKSHFFKQFPPK